ncbi:unnamed protein product, partial [marine sediment metagenome]
GVYWIDTIDEINSLIEFNNVTHGAKRHIPSITAKVEKDLVYPLLRGKDVRKWNAKPIISIIIPQDLQKRHNGMSESIMNSNYPLTYDYLCQFKTELSSRRTFQKFLKPNNLPFYSLYDIKNYTFSAYKVVWKEISTKIEGAVVHKKDSRVIIPDHKLVFVEFNDDSESHFFCALINSTPFNFFALSSSVTTQHAPKVLREIMVPQFDPSDSTHQDLSRLSKESHRKTAAGIDVIDLEEQIDELTAEIWELTMEELKNIKDSSAELR